MQNEKYKLTPKRDIVIETIGLACLAFY